MSTQYDKDLIWKLLNGAQHEACNLKANSDNPIWKHLTGAQNEVAQLKMMIGERNERISCLMMMAKWGEKWEEWANDTGFHPCRDCGDIIGQQKPALLGDYKDICYNCEMLTADEMEKPQ
jgi:hypothetical protein